MARRTYDGSGNGRQQTGIGKGRVNGKGSGKAKGRGNGKAKGRVNGKSNGKRLRSSALPRPARSAVPCLDCGLCCCYVAIEIDPPLTVKRATEALWFLYHDRISLYRDDDEWTLQFETPCRQQLDDNRCRIYPNRPHICRDLSARTCEVNSPYEGEYLTTPEAFLDFLRKKRPKVHDTLMQQGYLPEGKLLRRATRANRPRTCFYDRFRQMRSARSTPSATVGNKQSEAR